MVDTWFCPNTKKLLVEVTSFSDIQKLAVNGESLQKVDFGSTEVRGIIVTVRGNVTGNLS
jgi:hypothetical protein